MVLDADVDSVLQAKYLEWCSARVVDQFLRLTPDQIYELAQGADEQVAAKPAGVPERETSPGPQLPYTKVVKQVTKALTARMQLPTFAEWVAAYEESPERFDEDLLGLWREG